VTIPHGALALWKDPCWSRMTRPATRPSPNGWRDAIAAVGGTLTIDARPGRGTVVTGELPA
jgi:hypothetical protein